MTLEDVVRDVARRRGRVLPFDSVYRGDNRALASSPAPIRAPKGLPRLASKDLGVGRWAAVAGDLAPRGYRADDVLQSPDFPNCYLPAAFAAIAAQTPNDLARALTRVGSNQYVARFMIPDPRGRSTMISMPVAIDGRLPVSPDGKLLYSRNRDPGALWVPLLEKAFALSMDGYENILQELDAGLVLRAITGRPFQTGFIAKNDGGRGFGRVVEHFRQGRSVVVATDSRDNVGHPTRRPPTRQEEEELKRAGFEPGHAYAVVGLGQKQGEAAVVLANPWGQVEPANDGLNGVDDGRFALTSSEFEKVFAGFFCA